MLNIKIVDKEVSLDEIKLLAKETYEYMIKGTVDIVKEVVALGGQYHRDSAELLVKNGSIGNNVWGFNVVFDDSQMGYFLEYDSMVNIKPDLNNLKREILDEDLRNRVKEIVEKQITN